MEATAKEEEKVERPKDETSPPSPVPGPLSTIAAPISGQDDEDDDVMHLLTPEFVKMARYSNDGNGRELNRARALALGFKQKGLKIAPGANVRLGRNGAIGKNVFIGLFSYVNGDVVLEDDVLIGPHCSITSNSHKFNVAQQNFRGANENKPIRIGRGSWVAAGCSIVAGVSIGKCNLIAAGAVVTKDTADYAIVAGAPAKQIGSIDKDSGAYIWNKETPVQVSQDFLT